MAPRPPGQEQGFPRHQVHCSGEAGLQGRADQLLDIFPGKSQQLPDLGGSLRVPGAASR